MGKEMKGSKAVKSISKYLSKVSEQSRSSFFEVNHQIPLSQKHVHMQANADERLGLRSQSSLKTDEGSPPPPPPLHCFIFPALDVADAVLAQGCWHDPGVLGQAPPAMGEAAAGAGSSLRAQGAPSETAPGCEGASWRHPMAVPSLPLPTHTRAAAIARHPQPDHS